MRKINVHKILWPTQKIEHGTLTGTIFNEFAFFYNKRYGLDDKN